MNSIDQIQRQYIYTVQPVKLFETENSKAAKDNAYSFISKINDKETKYNPFHPNVLNNQLAQKLDVIS